MSHVLRMSAEEYDALLAKRRAERGPTKAKRKYRNQPVEVDGHKFDSKKEAERYRKLRMMEALGAINKGSIAVHTRYDLVVNGLKVGTYEADFVYLVPGTANTARVVVEDVKGYRSKTDPAYRLFLVKKALMKALHGLDVVEV